MDLDFSDCLGRVKLVLYYRKFHRTDVVVCSHFKESKTSSYSQIKVILHGKTKLLHNFRWEVMFSSPILNYRELLLSLGVGIGITVSSFRY